jgi:hypothetical protein
VRHQPASGIPFKVFAYQADRASVDPVPFAAVAGLARGARLFGVAAAFAGVGALIERAAPPRLHDRLLAGAGLATVAGFAIGLTKVVRHWSGPPPDGRTS